jgi:hypothetical protein
MKHLSLCLARPLDGSGLFSTQTVTLSLFPFKWRDILFRKKAKLTLVVGEGPNKVVDIFKEDDDEPNETTV